MNTPVSAGVLLVVSVVSLGLTALGAVVVTLRSKERWRKH